MSRTIDDYIIKFTKTFSFEEIEKKSSLFDRIAKDENVTLLLRKIIFEFKIARAEWHVDISEYGSYSDFSAWRSI